MYSIRPHNGEKIELDLPTTMYSVRPIIEPTQQSTQDSILQEIEHRQDILLEKLDELYKQLSLYQKGQASKSSAPSEPVLEELVVNLSAQQPSKDILNLIEKFRDNLSIRQYRHSSLRSAAFLSPIQNSSSTRKQSRSLVIVWGDGNDLPHMFHSRTKIDGEQAIVNLLSHELTSTN